MQDSAKLRMLVGFYFPSLWPEVKRCDAAVSTTVDALQHFQNNPADENALVTLDNLVVDMKDALDALKHAVVVAHRDGRGHPGPASPPRRRSGAEPRFARGGLNAAPDRAGELNEQTILRPKPRSPGQLHPPRGMLGSPRRCGRALGRRARGVEGLVSMSAPRPEGTEAASFVSRAPPFRIYAALDLGTNNCRLLIARPGHGGLSRHRRVFAHRSARRRPVAYRAAVRGGDRAHHGGPESLPRQDARARRHPRAAGGDRSLPRRRQRRAVPARSARSPRTSSGDRRPRDRGLFGRGRLRRTHRRRRRGDGAVRHRRRLLGNRLDDARGRTAPAASRPGNRCGSASSRSPRLLAATM